MGLLRGWDFGTLDVAGAFMHAPLPQTVRVLVNPPKAFVEAGLVSPGEARALQRAVYGLRVAPRARGKERDRAFLILSWKAHGKTYCPQQCDEDTLVWKITEQGVNVAPGLPIVHADDLLQACS